jgi:ZIP family zinc transporter
LAEALLWGLLSASSLIIGACLALAFSFSRRVVGLIMAFAAGVLISAVAYELVLEAVEEHDAGGAAVGLFAGAFVFFIGDFLISRAGAHRRKSVDGPSDDAALPIVLGTVLDGVPESAVLGLTLIDGEISLTMLIAVFLSNLPEALAATAGLKKGGWQPGRLLLLWAAVAGVSGLASMAGFSLFDNASERSVAFVLAFAGGAILTMLADTMMPEAYEDAGLLVGFVTTFGFATAFAIQALE